MALLYSKKLNISIILATKIHERTRRKTVKMGTIAAKLSTVHVP
jgi:hypothetical protein